MRRFFLLPGLILSALLHAGAVEVDPAKAVIVLPRSADGMVRFAASELQRHLKMATGVKIPVVPAEKTAHYAFIMAPPENPKPLAPEEARWEIGRQKAHIYGDSTRIGPEIDFKKILVYWNKTGVLSAVYAFLEDQLHFRFTSPGDMGTAYPEMRTLKLTPGNFNWAPRLGLRKIRPDYGGFRGKAVQKLKEMPKSYQEQYKKFDKQNQYEVNLWLKKMRQGRHNYWHFGHAFTQWWRMYGKSHPEYFALSKGKRFPPRKDGGTTIKMCPSCPGLVRQIVKNWSTARHRSKCINVCENDWGDFCECAACRKLDAPPASGARWDDNLSDRYLYLANEVAKLARKTDPGVVVTFYAYSNFRFPPQKFRVAPGVVPAFVPSMMEFEQVVRQYRGWKKMGAEKLFLRPNDHHVNTGLPMGFEKLLFDHFQLGIKNGIAGADYDSIHGFWESTGAADYILARAMIDPAKSFDHWMDEYVSVYGKAASEAKAYYAYYRREIFEKRIYPRREEIARKGKYGQFRRGLTSNIAAFYKEKDFDATDLILKKGLKKSLTPRQRQKLERLLLANQHSRLTVRAMKAAPADKPARGKELLQFRLSNWNKLQMHWYNLYIIEEEFDDITGIKRGMILGDWKEGKMLRNNWYFRLDPENRLEKEKLFRQRLDLKKDWSTIFIDRPWEKQFSHKNMPASLRERLKSYDGIGWYFLPLQVPEKWKGREIAIIFGAVDESAWIYLNGRPAGTRIFKGGDDWKKPFVIRIDPFINWKRKKQDLLVRVEDKKGLGGLWRPAMLVCR